MFYAHTLSVLLVSREMLSVVSSPDGAAGAGRCQSGGQPQRWTQRWPGQSHTEMTLEIEISTFLHIPTPPPPPILYMLLQHFIQCVPPDLHFTCL